MNRRVCGCAEPNVWFLDLQDLVLHGHSLNQPWPTKQDPGRRLEPGGLGSWFTCVDTGRRLCPVGVSSCPRQTGTKAQSAPGDVQKHRWDNVTSGPGPGLSLSPLEDEKLRKLPGAEQLTEGDDLFHAATNHLRASQSFRALEQLEPRRFFRSVAFVRTLGRLKDPEQMCLGD